MTGKMTEDQKIYRGSWGDRLDSMPELARYRVENPAPPLGGVQCPALEYTFAVSIYGGQSWHNPGAHEKQELRQSILETSGCCLKDLENCPVHR